MTLNDLERRNGCVVCAISPNLVALGAYYVKVVEDTSKLSATEIGYSTKNLVSLAIPLMAIFAGDYPWRGR